MLFRKFVVTACAMIVGTSGVLAAPTPVPGGANQVSALSARIGQTVFNGVLRVDVTELRDATAADHPERLLPSQGQKVMLMSVLLKNGTHNPFIDLVSYTLVDADGVSFQIGDYSIENANLNIQQGAAARQKALFVIDQNFVPKKLLVQCATCGSSSAFRAIRFTIP